MEDGSRISVQRDARLTLSSDLPDCVSVSQDVTSFSTNHLSTRSVTECPYHITKVRIWAIVDFGFWSATTSFYVYLATRQSFHLHPSLYPMNKCSTNDATIVLRKLGCTGIHQKVSLLATYTVGNTESGYSIQGTVSQIHAIILPGTSSRHSHFKI